MKKKKNKKNKKVNQMELEKKLKQENNIFIFMKK